MKNLSKDEMKKVVGGLTDYVCNATAQPGYHVESPGACTGDLDSCQTACDNWCTDANHCASCTCS